MAETPLHNAVWGNKNPDVIKALLAAGAKLEAQAMFVGNTPLQFAARFNENPAILEALLAAGADLEANGGYTPLREAARNNKNPDVIEALLAAGAKLEARDKYGYTALHKAALLNNENPDGDRGAARGPEPNWRRGIENGEHAPA